MSSGWAGSHRLRFDIAEHVPVNAPAFSLASPPSSVGPKAAAGDSAVSHAVERTREYLLSRQQADGHWVGELEGDTILESEYILLLAYLGRETSERAGRCANYLLEQQLPNGGWAIYPGGPLEISASVKGYFALKLTGHDPDSEPMCRARKAIVQAGGAERVNSFTRYYLALLGVISYEQCPSVPPELMLIPRWMPFNLHEMSAWSRTIIVPLSLLWAFRPVRHLPEGQGIRELFIDAPEHLPITMGCSEVVDDLTRRTRINWDVLFRRLDRWTKVLERLHIKPLRGLAVLKAARWMIDRFEGSDGLGAIFPPIIWSVVALKCLGYDDDSAEVRSALDELDRLSIHEGRSTRLQPCQSPVWDTALSTIALRDAGVPSGHPAIRHAVDWLLQKEVRRKGDWSVLNPKMEPGGWFFEYHNEFYPDTDDTAMVLIALTRCLPKSELRGLSIEFLMEGWSPHAADRDASAVVSARTGEGRAACAELEALTPQLSAVRRGLRWILAMQGRDGGWGAFDRDNDRELFTRVPFADHNAMIDPSSADLSARMLEMFAGLNISADYPPVRQALDYVWREQEPDHCWYGRWGVNYIYGTWQSLVGLTAIGTPSDDPRIRSAAAWLKSKQQACGGWGETPASYDDPTLRGHGPPTASQTAWALMGLLAAGEGHSETVRRGIAYLIDTQKSDGTWEEPFYTGTGFPRVFYLKYHLYRIYFPLMALARYQRLTTASA